MPNDYQNFVERMGSFDLDLSEIDPKVHIKMEEDKNLAHFGILGMKWGVRRTDAQLGRASKSSSSDDYQKAQELKAKGVKNLSTQELKDLTQRMQLEQQFSTLNPTNYKKGMDVAKAILATGTTVASIYALVKTPLVQDVTKAIKAGVSASK